MLGVLIWSKPEFCTGGIGSKFAGFSTDRSMSFRDMLSFLLVEEVHIYTYMLLKDAEFSTSRRSAYIYIC